ncbi:MAG: type II toxin-antitoxin system Phd/YefM family antitoxin [Kiloniellales bacterium]
MKTIDASDFSARCLALIDQVTESGETLVVTKDGKPLVELRPVVRTRPKGERPRTLLGAHKGEIEILGDIVSPIYRDPDSE